MRTVCGKSAWAGDACEIFAAFRAELYQLFAGHAASGQTAGAERRIIRALAEQGDCIIVGRGANAVLADFRPFSLFVYADTPAKLARCRARAPEGEHLTDRELEKRIRQVDMARAGVNGMVSGLHWGDKAGYHLCINTSGMEIKCAAPHVAAYATQWLRGQG